MWCVIDGGRRCVEPVAQREMGMDMFRDGLEGGGRGDSRESVNGTIALTSCFWKSWL